MTWCFYELRMTDIAFLFDIDAVRTKTSKPPQAVNSIQGLNAISTSPCSSAMSTA